MASMLLVAALYGVLAFPAQADITGNPRVIDGDTIDIEGQRIRLHGIDAPESKQTCRKDGRRWPRGKEATAALRTMVRDKMVSCQERDQDHYGRIVAVCHLAGEDLNAALVAQGWALAYRRYSTDYVDEEEGARKAGAGMWQGQFVPPWDWPPREASVGHVCGINAGPGRQVLPHLPQGEGVRGILHLQAIYLPEATRMCM